MSVVLAWWKNIGVRRASVRLPICPTPRNRKTTIAGPVFCSADGYSHWARTSRTTRNLNVHTSILEIDFGTWVYLSLGCIWLCRDLFIRACRCHQAEKDDRSTKRNGETFLTVTPYWRQIQIWKSNTIFFRRKSSWTEHFSDVNASWLFNDWLSHHSPAIAQSPRHRLCWLYRVR